MSRLLIVAPLPIAGLAVDRGSGADNLLTDDPKEVWASADGNVSITVDLGAATSVDTVFLGFITGATAASTWTIYGGLAAAREFVIQASSPLRVPDGGSGGRAHALFFGAAATVRFITLAAAIERPATIGRLIVGRAFAAKLGQEWGGGRQPLDTGSATDLPSGGYSVVEGARKRSFSWTFGDLSVEEADRLELIALELGETRPGLVVEDYALTSGLRARIHYGLFKRWQQYERRNRAQTRWEVGINEWV